jgi:hypothetical protein
MSGRILDVGAGEGGMGQLLNWPKIQTNKCLIGCDIGQKSNLPSGYSDWIEGGWEKIFSGSKYNGVLAIHIIEHLESWRRMVHSVINMMNPNALIYLEWPAEETVLFPPATEVWKKFGTSTPGHARQLLTTFNFFDDNTHESRPPSMKEVLYCLKGFKILENGPAKSNESAMGLVAKGLDEDSTSNVTLGMWSHFGFAQYVLAEKVAQD